MSCSSRRLDLLVAPATSSMLEGRLLVLKRPLVGEGEREVGVPGNRPDERRLLSSPLLSWVGDVDLDQS